MFNKQKWGRCSKDLAVVTSRSSSCSRMFQHLVTMMGANLCEPHHQYLDVVLGVQLRLCNSIVFCIIVPVLVCPLITFCDEFACNILYTCMYWMKNVVIIF